MTDMNTELQVMRSIDRNLQKLDKNSRSRVISYFSSKDYDDRVSKPPISEVKFNPGRVEDTAPL